MNILKNDKQLTLNKYFNIKRAEQHNKLYNMSEKKNDELAQKKEQERFYNLPISTIANNFTNKLVDILNDLSSYFMNETFNWSSFIYIFIKEDRLIYTGILFIILSFFFYFMDISS